MTEPENTTEMSDEQPTEGFQWKWVVLSLLVYMIFYFLPLMMIPGGIIRGGVANELSYYVLGIWGTAGVFIISAIMAYFSPGITVWEAVVSALGVVILAVVIISLESNRLILDTTQDVVGLSVLLLVVFGMSYMGGWWGERLQNIKEIIEDYPMEIEGAEGDAGSDDQSGEGRS